MTDDSHNLRSPAGQRPAGAEDRSPTIRTTPVDLDPSALPDQASQYVAPTPLPRMAEHKTIDMVPVRLAPEINPRNALTQRLAAAPSQQRGPGLLLSGLVAVLVLAVLVLGTIRLLGSPSSAVLPAGATTRAVAPFDLPQESALPAAAVIKEPAPVVAKPVAPTGPRSATRSSSGESSAPAASQPRAKGREVWLE